MPDFDAKPTRRWVLIAGAASSNCRKTFSVCCASTAFLAARNPGLVRIVLAPQLRSQSLSGRSPLCSLHGDDLVLVGQAAT
jgi:hypothetical protein